MTARHRDLGLSFSLAAAAAISLAAAAPLHAQAQAPSGGAARSPAAAEQPLPEDYIRPAPVQPGRAPGMKVQESSANQRVFEVRLTTGDELLSGLTDLAL
ncbi:MAG TPA: hypothetical protein VFV10_00160, partial [Gammaproteobacteria bacterium]|nr:hypothetical protein [Gammaproteobacteria bacterium]